MKNYSPQELRKKLLQIVKYYIKTKKSDELKILRDINIKYRLHTFFWKKLTSSELKGLLNLVLTYVISNRDIVKTLNYYFANMRKGDYVKHYAILEFIAIAYRSIAPTTKDYPRLYRRRN